MVVNRKQFVQDATKYKHEHTDTEDLHESSPLYDLSLKFTS